MAGRIRTLIVDDERSSRRSVEMQLAGMPDVEVVGQAANGEAAVELIRSLKPDLVFLDVQMPELDGFDVLHELGPDELPRIVFVTAHDEFAVRAFEVNAVDYLLKPVDDRKLKRALDRVRREQEDQDDEGIAGRVRELMEHMEPEKRGRPGTYKKRLLVKQKGEYFFVLAGDVEWIEAEGNYARIHVDERTHLIRRSLNELESALDPELFLRIHRGAIINLDRVETIQPYGVSDYRVVLRSGRTVNVGRTYRNSLLQRKG